MLCCHSVRILYSKIIKLKNLARCWGNFLEAVTAAMSRGILHAFTVSLVLPFQMRQLRPREIREFIRVTQQVGTRIGFPSGAQCWSLPHCLLEVIGPH